MIQSIFHRHRQLPDDLWVQCPGCRELIYRREYEDNLYTCAKCGHHGRLSAGERLQTLLDPDTWAEEDRGLLPADPLGFVSKDQRYVDKLAETQEKTGLEEAVLTGAGEIDGAGVRVAVCDFAFLGASMGSVMGEKIARAAERSAVDRLPLVLVTSSGGARMHEGIFSLMQMAKTSTALARLGAAGVPTISVLADPTTGGVTASFASLGDVILVEAGALIGFAGPRVIEQTTKQRLPPDAQRPEFLLKHGMIDAVVHRRELRSTLAKVLRLLSAVGEGSAGLLPNPSTGSGQAPATPGGSGQETPSDPPRGDGTEQAARSTGKRAGPGAEIHVDGRVGPPADEPSEDEVWRVVQRARDPNRPFTLDYVAAIFTEFFELRGDRLFADDPAVVGGLASVDGCTVAIVGHQKGRTTQERLARRFGMARPEGYRKALRIMRLAEKFGFPIVTFIDTPGADPSLEAEQRGQAWAIAANLFEMSGIRVPIVAVVIGEGGSGGALAIGVADRLLMLENATYSVVSPEGCASILWNDAGLAKQAAAAMKMTAAHVVRAGVADGIILEPGGGAEMDYVKAADGVREALLRFLSEINAQYGGPSCLDGAGLVAARYEKYRRIGVLTESGSYLSATRT